MSEAKMERQALEWLLKTVEAMRCPQTIADVALLMLKFKGPVEFARKVLASPSPAPVAQSIPEYLRGTSASPTMAGHLSDEARVAAADQGIKEEPSNNVKARERDWPEDFQHENGRYLNTCHSCGKQFMGHKRRVTCKSCANSVRNTSDAISPQVSKEVSESDEEWTIERLIEEVAHEMKGHEEAGYDRTCAFANATTNAIRRAKEVSESADTARLEAISSKALGAVELAWGIIANAGEGNWERESKDWQEAATDWRDRQFHQLLDMCGGHAKYRAMSDTNKPPQCQQRDNR